jgi:ketosteroid isomerase-like protein
MRMLKNIFLCSFILFCFAICSCKAKENTDITAAEKNRDALLEADRKFAEMCGTKGMKDAYLEFIDSNGVLLRPNVYPIVGADAVDFIIAQKTEDLLLEWRAKDAVVAVSGELAYTYGTYKISLRGSEESMQGSYVTIWKKQPDGKWKFVLDTNNEGLGGY